MASCHCMQEYEHSLYKRFYCYITLKGFTGEIQLLLYFNETTANSCRIWRNTYCWIQTSKIQTEKVQSQTYRPCACWISLKLSTGSVASLVTWLDASANTPPQHMGSLLQRGQKKNTKLMGLIVSKRKVHFVVFPSLFSAICSGLYRLK